MIEIDWPALRRFLAEKGMGWTFDPAGETSYLPGSRPTPYAACYMDSSGKAAEIADRWLPDQDGNHTIALIMAMRASGAYFEVHEMQRGDKPYQPVGLNVCFHTVGLCFGVRTGDFQQSVCLAAARALGWES